MSNNDYNDTIFLPSSTINLTMKQIAYSTLVQFVFFYLFYFMFKQVSSETTKELKASSAAHRSYQLIHFVMNVLFGMAGLYYWRHVHVNVKEYTDDEKVAGFIDYSFFGAYQIGYQIWGFIVGCFPVISERPEMLAHHVGVVLLGFKSSFLKSGFRYYSIYFFGIVEVSSIPLSIVNAFKKNEEWIKKHPTFYSVIRLLFGFSFLPVRVFFFMPLWLDWLRNIFAQVLVSHYTVLKIYYTFCLVAGLFLAALNMYWGVLVSKGIGKAIIDASTHGNKKKGDSKKE